MRRPPDEFAWIERLRPLTRGDPNALNLMDDAAVLPSRPGFDLVISTDSMVEGVHFLQGEALDIVARRLLRTSLSDLAAKAADPFGYFLNIAWPARFGDTDRDRFIAGLDHDGRAFDVALLGGDTVGTPGPLTASATVLGWVPEGTTIRRSGARAGHALVMLGFVGDGWLGLKAARGEMEDPDGALAAHYRLPEPLFAARDLLRNHATAAADVSDGLLADAGHIAEASGIGFDLNLDGLPLSADAARWVEGQKDRASALVSLATGGDDYAIVCAVPEGALTALLADAARARIPAAALGRFRSDAGVAVTIAGREVKVDRTGWRH